MPQKAKLELFQDERRYAGIELAERNPKYREAAKPLRLCLFNNNYGTFEASYDLTRDDAEAMRDWLVEFFTESAPQ